MHYLIICHFHLCHLKNSRGYWRVHSYEGNIFHDIHNGWWLVWYSCWSSSVEAISHIPYKECFLGQNRAWPRAGHGSWKPGFLQLRTTITAVFSAWACICSCHTNASSLHHSVFQPCISCFQTPGTTMFQFKSPLCLLESYSHPVENTDFWLQLCQYFDLILQSTMLYYRSSLTWVPNINFPFLQDN